MRVAWTTLALVAAVSAAPGVAIAQTSMTLAEALARARERAPQVVSARLAIEESRGLLAGADHLQSNPEVNFGLGSRRGTDASTDLDIGYAQSFEPSARRSSRSDVAKAALNHTVAEVQEVTRQALRETAVAFVHALHSSDRMRLLDRTSELAANVLDIADRRFRAGDIAVLDVNMARAALARARAARQGAAAEQSSALGDLKALLQIDGDLEVRGDLVSGAAPPLGVLLEAAENLPELRSLDAAIKAAEAERQFGVSFGRSDFGVEAHYRREQGDQILFGGLTVMLPWSSKGQEPIAVATARVNRLRADREAARLRGQIGVRSALEAYQRRAAAVETLQREAMPGLDENDTLAARSFEVGQLGLAELLLIRREILETRFQYLDALLEAALARVEVDARTGVLQ